MSYFVVFLLAAAAGVAVGFATIREARMAPARSEAWTETYREGAAPESTSPVAKSKRRLPPDPNPRTRKIGAAGLFGIVVGAAGLLALIAYLAWTLLKGIFSTPPA
jgi:hypothetical protein